MKLSINIKMFHRPGIYPPESTPSGCTGGLPILRLNRRWSGPNSVLQGPEGVLL